MNKHCCKENICKCPKCKQKEKEGHEKECWFHRWRHIAAYIFLIICVFDFIIMPIVYEKNDKIKPAAAVELSLKYSDTTTQHIALQTIIAKRSWEPLTLKSNGMFFMAFGAILGVAAFTRGQERILKANINAIEKR